MTPCSDEGEKINVEKEGVRCFTCVCKNRYVECLKEYCPSLEGCHMLMEKPKGACCAKCKGCFHDGTMRESGEEWSALGDPCRVMTCKAGVVTETRQECYTPCSNPIPPAPGQCCPTCPGCLLNRENVTEDLEVAWVEDPCVRCRCQKGRLACYKRACPVLNCHSAFIEMKPGHCCPRCKRSSRIFEPPNGSCLLGNKLHQSSEEFHPDLCTKCTCSNRTSHCVRHTCPPLDCPPEHQDTPKNHCCPICMNVIETKPTCTHAGRTYKDGEGWKLDECQSCMCKKGQVRCTVAVCPESNKPCPLNHKLTKLPGHCCPKCVESDGICTVFGDPHYRTFDGKFFSFQGSCKYQLTADCIDHTFSIRVTNDARHTKTSSWTKTVSIKIAGWKVNLGERKRVKLSGVKVKVPFMSRKVNITNTDDSILVETELGIKVVWDGNSFLEVSVPPRYKEKLCGLCGNYNGLSRDDMLSRRGIYMIEGDRLGASWRVGGRKACTRSPRISKKSKQCSPKTMRPGLRKALHRMCAPLSSSVFAACHNKLNYDIYKESCLVDMCECPTMKCYCESFTAYAHECRRLGVPLVNWRAETNCTTLTRHKGQ